MVIKPQNQSIFFTVLPIALKPARVRLCSSSLTLNVCAWACRVHGKIPFSSFIQK